MKDCAKYFLVCASLQSYYCPFYYPCGSLFGKFCGAHNTYCPGSAKLFLALLLLMVVKNNSCFSYVPILGLLLQSQCWFIIICVESEKMAKVESEHV